MNKTESERLVIVEGKVDSIVADVSDIKNNHLPHIMKRLDWLGAKDNWVLALVGILVGVDLALVGLCVKMLIGK